MSFLKQSLFLKLCCVSQLISSQSTTWVQMKEVLIQDELKKGSYKWERRNWSPAEALLSMVPIHTRSRIVNSILDSWSRVLEKLQFDVQQDVLPAHLSIHQLLILLCREVDLTDGQQRSIVSYCRVRNLFSTADLCQEIGEWKPIDLI